MVGRETDGLGLDLGLGLVNIHMKYQHEWLEVDEDRVNKIWFSLAFDAISKEASKCSHVWQILFRHLTNINFVKYQNQDSNAKGKALWVE